MIHFDKNSLVSQILVIFILFNIIAITTFTFYVLQQDRKSTIQNVEDSLQAIATEKANTVSLVMGQAVKEAESLAKWSNEFLASENSTILPDYYKKGENGVLYRDIENGADASKYSSIFFPANGDLNQEAIKSINAT